MVHSFDRSSPFSFYRLDSYNDLARRAISMEFTASLQSASTKCDTKTPEDAQATSDGNFSQPAIMPKADPPPLPSTAATAPVATRDADGENVLLEIVSSDRISAPGSR
jgi:hypothetical protein